MLGVSHWIASAFVVSIAMLIPRGAEAERSNGDVVVEWNQLLQTNITGLPIGQPRSYAMLHVAMADAVIAVRGRYEPFHAHVKAPEDASAEAAAAQAGHDVLVALFPAAQAAAALPPLTAVESKDTSRYPTALDQAGSVIYASMLMARSG
jgi:hypothetical protein